jgi:DNA-binding response OmpR family regulator
VQSSTKTRIILLDDLDSIRNPFTKFLNIHGYEVFSFSNPMICPLQIEPECRCSENQSCTDIIISDLDMPGMTGLNFIQNQRNKNCKCRHIALMSGLWTAGKLDHADELRCKIFTKPVLPQDILLWIKEVEKGINPDRELCNWFEEIPSKID